ncbi:hypothetical protein QOZ80_5AG0373690 [Eleusine coracana subsp. coracana]|nr:hypothetical protein QOZ80_5AG0373690 [Eleusine coracana subsp. coracana]
MSSSSAPGSPPSTGSQKKRGPPKDSVGLYAVQCSECHKRQDCSCDDPGDIEYDNTRIWVIDKPNIPKPPPETERLVIMRSDYTKMDTYYVMPNGKRARCTGDVDKFLEAHPEYKDRISVSSFSFAPPKIVEDTVSHNSAWKAAKAKKQGKAGLQSGQKPSKL